MRNRLADSFSFIFEHIAPFLILALIEALFIGVFIGVSFVPYVGSIIGIFAILGMTVVLTSGTYQIIREDTMKMQDLPAACAAYAPKMMSYPLVFNAIIVSFCFFMIRILHRYLMTLSSLSASSKALNRAVAYIAVEPPTTSVIVKVIIVLFAAALFKALSYCFLYAVDMLTIGTVKDVRFTEKGFGIKYLIGFVPVLNLLFPFIFTLVGHETFTRGTASGANLESGTGKHTRRFVSDDSNIDYEYVTQQYSQDANAAEGDADGE